MAISPQRLIRFTYIARIIFAIAQLSCIAYVSSRRSFGYYSQQVSIYVHVTENSEMVDEK